MSKSKCDGAEELTLINCYKIGSKKCRSIKSIRSISYQPKSTEILLCHKYMYPRRYPRDAGLCIVLYIVTCITFMFML